MINPSADGLRLEPGESYGELGYAVYGLCVFVNTRDDDLRIQSCIAQCSQPSIRCRRQNEPDRRRHRRSNPSEGGAKRI
jgi:hypothetical protein